MGAGLMKTDSHQQGPASLPPGVWGAVVSAIYQHLSWVAILNGSSGDGYCDALPRLSCYRSECYDGWRIMERLWVEKSCVFLQASDIPRMRTGIRFQAHTLRFYMELMPATVVPIRYTRMLQRGAQRVPCSTHWQNWFPG
jgi:hypothetical protein